LKKDFTHWVKVSVVVLGWAITPVVGDYLVDKHSQLSPFQLSFFRYFFASIAIYLILISQKGFRNLQILSLVKIKWKQFLLASTASAAMPVLLFFSVKWTTASSSSFLLNFNVVIISVLAFIFMIYFCFLVSLIGKQKFS